MIKCPLIAEHRYIELFLRSTPAGRQSGDGGFGNQMGGGNRGFGNDNFGGGNFNMNQGYNNQGNGDFGYNDGRRICADYLGPLLLRH